MKITRINFGYIHRGTANACLRAIASVTLDDFMAIHKIRILQGKGGLRIAMPFYEDTNGLRRDVIHPISREARAWLDGEILQAYHFKLREWGEEPCGRRKKAPVCERL